MPLTAQMAPHYHEPVALVVISSISLGIAAIVALWILVDIVAVTFSTDVGRLKMALLKSEPTWARSMVIEDSSSIWDGE